MEWKKWKVMSKKKKSGKMRECNWLIDGNERQVHVLRVACGEMHLISIGIFRVH